MNTKENGNAPTVDATSVKDRREYQIPPELQAELTVPEKSSLRESKKHDGVLYRAFVYAQREGWLVIPVHSVNQNGQCSCGKATCQSKGKHPATRNGLKDGTIDHETIISMFQQHDAESARNVGVVTGRVSGIFVLDIDTKNDGFESLRRLVKANDAFPDTLTVTTGGGGRHFYFRYPEKGSETVTLSDRRASSRGGGPCSPSSGGSSSVESRWMGRRDS